MLRGVLSPYLNALVGAQRPPRAVSRIALMAATLLALQLAAGPALAHDPSSWGGLFRSRDAGIHWFVANEGRFVTAAVAVAVDPTDPNHLLLATDSGLLHSHNGGRDWTESGAGLLRGLILAVAFAPEGGLALAASGAGLFLSNDSAETWQMTGFPLTAGLITSIQITPSGRHYIAARQGVLRSGDRAATWQDVSQGLPEGQVQALVVRSDPAGPERLYAVINGRLFASASGATWRPFGSGLPSGELDLVAAGQREAELWAAGQALVYRSEDAGLTWRPLPSQLEPPSTRVHAIQVADSQTTLVLAGRRCPPTCRPILRPVRWSRTRPIPRHSTSASPSRLITSCASRPRAATISASTPSTWLGQPPSCCSCSAVVGWR